jgi:pimeloyl-ACP methyl ester carboxylesterase
VAAWCALVHPDVFRSVVLMSAPFAGPPALPLSTAETADAGRDSRAIPPVSIHDALAALTPPRKHYHWYYSTREANGNMRDCPQGIHAFLRAYFHYKSADWKQNRPHPLLAWTAEELAKLPTHYIMERDKGLAETVAPEMPSAAAIAACRWLPDDEWRVYGTEFGRTGFQGVHQRSGDVEAMQARACTQLRGCHLVEEAGHWVQQEQPAQVSELLLRFLRPAIT